MFQSMYTSCSSSGSPWPSRGDFFFNSVCWSFQQKTFNKQIVEVYKLPTCVWSCKAPCVWVCVALVLDACRMVGIQRRLLNYICTKTTDLHTRRASLPASRQVSQRADAAPTKTALPFISHVCTWLLYFSLVKLFGEKNSRIKLWLSLVKRTHCAMIKHKQIQQTNTDLWLIPMTSAEASTSIFGKWLRDRNSNAQLCGC